MRMPLALAALMLTMQSMAAGDEWRVLKAEHYTVVSQLSDRDTKSWAQEYDQFIASTAGMLRINASTLPPLTVVLFRQDKDFQPYKFRKDNGKAANIAGLFARRGTWGVIGMARDSERENTRRTIFHEGVHWLMAFDQGRQPAWFSEGVAEMFATFERTGGKVNWAKPIDNHLWQLNSSALMPLKDLMTARSALFDRDDRTGMFYAQAWAFVHFMTLGKDAAHRDKLTQYLHAYRTMSAEDAIATVFGAAFDELEREFRRYVSQRSFNYVQLPINVVPVLPDTVPASPGAAEVALGFLALGGGNIDLARTHATRVLELNPSQPQAYEMLAYLAEDDHDPDKAALHAEQAVMRGSTDADMFMKLGDSYRSGRNSDKPRAELLRTKLYENAINLTPRRLAPYEGLVEALAKLDKPTEEDGKFLALGVKQYPAEDWLKVGVAILAYKRSDHANAISTMAEALRANSSLDGSQRDFAVHLRRNWYVNAMNDQIAAAREKNDPRAALAVIESYRERLADDEDLRRYLKELKGTFEVQDLLDQVRRAQSAGRNGEARALLDQLLARDDLPPDLRQFAERLKSAGRRQ
jgi:hypothetical protein